MQDILTPNRPPRRPADRILHRVGAPPPRSVTPTPRPASDPTATQPPVPTPEPAYYYPESEEPEEDDDHGMFAAKTAFAFIAGFFILSVPILVYWLYLQNKPNTASPKETSQTSETQEAAPSAAQTMGTQQENQQQTNTPAADTPLQIQP